MKRVDKRGAWMVNTSAFRMHDPMSDTYFEAGELVQATDTAWRQTNKAIIKLADDEGNLIDDPDTLLSGATAEPEKVEEVVEPAKTNTTKK